MSTVLSPSAFEAAGVSAAPVRAPVGLPRWTREPLLHFVLLGAALFAVDAWFFARTEDPNTIVVGKEVDEEAIRVFESSRGRPPNADELRALRQVWLDNEVLYREGLALGLDKGDSAIRERVIFKSLSMIDAGTKLPPYDDQVLRDWFQRNRSRYDAPARFDFQEAAITGASSAAAVRAFVSALNAGARPDAQAGLRIFTGRPHSNLVQSYGEAFAVELEQMPRGEWRALHSREGWRAVRLEAVTPPQPADFEQLRGVVQQDWTDMTLAAQRSAAVQVLAQKYAIRFEGAAQ